MSSKPLPILPGAYDSTRASAHSGSESFRATPPILPGATLGILGGGQLGRMFTLAARTMGYKVMVLDPDFASPAGQMADVHLQADYTDHGALRQLGAPRAAPPTEVR